MPYAPTLNNHDILRWGRRCQPFNMDRKPVLGKIYIRFKKGLHRKNLCLDANQILNFARNTLPL